MKQTTISSKLSHLLVPSKLSNLYASIIDQRQFSSLGSIMWDEFSMSGHFEINGLENFISAMQQLENYQSTMHQIMNVMENGRKIYTQEEHIVLLAICLMRMASLIN